MKFFFYLDEKEKAPVPLKQPVFCREMDAKVGHNTEVLNTMKISPSKLTVRYPCPPPTHTQLALHHIATKIMRSQSEFLFKSALGKSGLEHCSNITSPALN